MRIAITGGGGSIATAVIKQMVGKHEIVVFEHDQHKLHWLDGEFKGKIQLHEGSVRELDPLCDAFMGCDVVLHTAAGKYVPISEIAPKEVYKTNTIGTLNAIIAANLCGVPKFYLMSTDKAVNPSSVMGCSKEDAERVTLAMGHSVIRSGNAIGSEGCFLDSIPRLTAENKSAPITSKDDSTPSRFIVEINDLASFIVDCLDKKGQIFIPEMDEVNILAYLKKRYGEFDYHLVPMRPGEKMHEELMNFDEEVVEDIEGWGKIIKKK